jgi:hypothetical protein
LTVTSVRAFLRQQFGTVPYSAELYQRYLAAGAAPASGFPLEKIAERLPAWAAAASEARKQPIVSPVKKIFLTATLRWWIEYCLGLGFLLYGAGYDVVLGYFPYRRWTEPMDEFHRRRQAQYMQDIFKGAGSTLSFIDLSSLKQEPLDNNVLEQVKRQSLYDVKYTLQREVIDLESRGKDQALYQLRLDRNRAAANAFEKILSQSEFDAVVLPNGSILEFGMGFRIAKTLNLKTVTFEFGEQRERIWLDQDREVMRQDTSDLWSMRGEDPLTLNEQDALTALYAARTGGKQWGRFARQWQSTDQKGGENLRSELQLDPDRPVVLLCTNVVGDSLALDRELFTDGMSDWLEHTVRYFAARNDSQLVIRVHPGELRGAGYPSVDIVQQALPDMPENVLVIPPAAPVNTYDLIDLADLGLVYTSTVGLEMAMRGVPVIVSGETHYRRKGFTQDPQTAEEYYSMIDLYLNGNNSRKMSDDQIRLAWHYAYVYFFEYPFEVPWHLIGFWQDIDERPLEEMLQPDRLARYRRTIEALGGGAVTWRA